MFRLWKQGNRSQLQNSGRCFSRQDMHIFKDWVWRCGNTLMWPRGRRLFRWLSVKCNTETQDIRLSLAFLLRTQSQTWNRSQWRQNSELLRTRTRLDIILNSILRLKAPLLWHCCVFITWLFFDKCNLCLLWAEAAARANVTRRNRTATLVSCKHFFNQLYRMHQFFFFYGKSIFYAL